MFRWLFNTRVTEKIYDRFIDTGYVPDHIIRRLAFKIIKDEPLNEMEMAIFVGKTTEINEMIVQFTRQKN